MESLGLPMLSSFPNDLTQAPPPPPSVTQAGPLTCKNCGTVPTSVLRCSQCKRAAYCSPKCAKDDWPYHKRTCEKPKPKTADKVAAAAAPQNAPPSPIDAPKPPTPSASNSGGTDEVELDDEERAAVEEMKKKGGYRLHYRSKEDAAQWKDAVGEITHVKVDSGLASVQAPLPAQGAASQASAWNTAGSLEQRNLGPWVRDRLKSLLREARRSGELYTPVPGVGRLVCTGIAGFGDSTADILIRSGKAKHVYDMSFKVGADLLLDKDGSSITAEEVDVEMADEGAESIKSNEKEGDGKADDKIKPRRLYLRFADVSNMSEGDVVAGGSGREVRVEFAEGFSVEQQEKSRTALMVTNTQVGFTAELRRIVEQVVAEFKLK